MCVSCTVITCYMDNVLYTESGVMAEPSSFGFFPCLINSTISYRAQPRL